MNISEFSTQFDVLFNNVTSNQAPGLNEYEKSVFLTKAQSQLVKEYFNRRTDGFGGGYDGSEKRQYDFSGLIRVETLYQVNTFKDRISTLEKLDKRSKVFLYPANYFLTVNELISDGYFQYNVIPIDYMEYSRLMMKPYNFPVKRAAWRLITDKKNCNYCHESYATYGEDSETGDYLATDYIKLPDNDNSAQADYKIMTTWADQKRNLRLTIRYYNWTPSFTSSDEEERNLVNGIEAFLSNKMYFNALGYMCKVVTDAGWDNTTNTTYDVALNVFINNNADCDDEETIEVLKIGFKKLLDEQAAETFTITNGDLWKSAIHLDGMTLCSAPSKFSTFGKTEVVGSQTVVVGRTFETHIIKVPFAEVIGKFKGAINYQIRFVRELTPIILENLDNYGYDLTIDGYTHIMECELPSECHEEILERAVTLAKIAWQGGTMTQAQAAQRNRED